MKHDDLNEQEFHFHYRYQQPFLLRIGNNPVQQIRDQLHIQTPALLIRKQVTKRGVTKCNCLKGARRLSVAESN